MAEFDEAAAARTRAADLILKSADMLAAFEAVNGHRGDLEAIRDHGARAEALNLAQTEAQRAGTTATLDLLNEIAGVQREYVLIMAAVKAARAALADQEEPPEELIAQLDAILKDEARVTVRTTTFEDGSTVKKQQASRAQEAVRAEIERDASSLIALTEAHAELAARRVDVARLTRLRDRAAALAGKLATRSEKKGGAKGSTKAEHDAVNRQNLRWEGTARTLTLAAERHDGIAQLLKDAARSKKKKKKKA